MKLLILLSLLLQSTLLLANDGNSIVFIGDSLTEGYGVQKDSAYPALIQAKITNLGKKYKVINAGISGSTTASASSRVKWFIKSKPQIIVLALGANDGLRGIDTKSTYKNLEKAIMLAKEQKIKIVLGGMYLPKNYGKQYTKDFRKVFLDLKKNHDLVFIPFMLEGVGGVSKYNIEDGIHPNDDGHKIVADTVFKYLEPLL
jgi:acyl-CoA thioesterase-1